MDATSTIQDSIHVFNLVHKYVSRILGTYQIVSGVFLFYSNNMLRFLYMIEKIYDKIDINSEHKFSGR